MVSAAEALRKVVTDVSVKINVGVGTPRSSSASARDVRFIACPFVLEGTIVCVSIFFFEDLFE